MRLLSIMICCGLLAGCSDSTSIPLSSVPPEHQRLLLLQQFTDSMIKCEKIGTKKSPAFNNCMASKGFPVISGGTYKVGPGAVTM